MVLKLVDSKARGLKKQLNLPQRFALEIALVSPNSDFAVVSRGTFIPILESMQRPFIAAGLCFQYLSQFPCDLEGMRPVASVTKVAMLS